MARLLGGAGAPGDAHAVKYLRPMEIALVQAVGVICVVIAAWGAYDGWAALGAFGISLLVVAELVGRRTPL